LLIYSLCDYSGEWAKPYKEAGHAVVLVDLKYGQDVRLLRKPEDSVDVVLAAPPCTEFSFAKHFHGTGNFSHNFVEGLSIVDACLRFILICQPSIWALENPKGYLRRWLGEPQLTFEPWQFGDNYRKVTDLWGQFTLPKPIIKERPKGLLKFSQLHSVDIAPEYYGAEDRQTRRAITPAGFARAFYKANKEVSNG